MNSQKPEASCPQLRCVILAAGASLRLRPLTDSIPKCLLDVGGKTLLQRMIENVLGAGIIETAVVLGYRSDMAQEFIAERFPEAGIKFIYNREYRSTNNAYSLLLARPFLEEEDGNTACGLLLLDSDILFSSDLLPYLLKDNAKDKIAVRRADIYDEEEVKIKAGADRNIIMIGKSTPVIETYGESIGIEVFSSSTLKILLKSLEQIIGQDGGKDEYYESAFQKMIDNGVLLKAVDISRFPAMEIDTLEDYRTAQQMKIGPSDVFLP